MKFTILRVGVLCLLLLLSLSVTTLGQGRRYNPCDPRYAYGIRPPCATIAGTAAKILSDLTKLRGEKLKFNNQIEQARQRFFKEYPNGPNRAEAQREFAHLLFQKDFWLFYLAFQAGGGETYGSKEASIALDKFTGLGVELDNGIRPLAFDSFYDWASFYYKKVMGSPTNRQINSLDDFINKIALGAANSEAHQASMDEYERYRLARDWAEFAAAGYSLTDNPKDYLITLFIIERPYNQKPEKSNAEQATEFYQLMAKVVGEEAMLKAAKQLMAAQKGQSYRITVNGESLQPYTAFKSFLAEAGKRASVMTILSDIRREISLESADKEYKQLVAAYGENALFDAAAQVHRAHKEYGDNNTASINKSLGVQRGNSDHFAFEELLANRDPKGNIRAILAFKKNLTSVAEVNAANSQLTSTYGEQAVKSAGEKIVAFWKSDLPADAPKEYHDFLQKYLLGMTYEYPDSGVTASQNSGGKRSSREYFNSVIGVYGLSIGLLDGSKSLPRAITDAEKIDNPQYTEWAKYKPGTTVTYAYRSGKEKGGKFIPHDVRNLTTLRSNKLISLDSQSAIIEEVKRTYALGVDTSGSDGLDGIYKHEIRSRVLKPNFPPNKPPDFSTEDSGDETLDIGGKIIHCHWISSITKSANESYPNYEIRWESDEVPEKLVRKKTGRIFPDYISVEETVLQPRSVENLAAQTVVPELFFEPKTVSGKSPSLNYSQVAKNPQTPRTVNRTQEAANTKISDSMDIPTGSGLTLVTFEAIHLRKIDSGGRFRAKLEQAVEFGGEILLPIGTDVFLKAKRQREGVMLTVDYIIKNGKRITVTTNENYVPFSRSPQSKQSSGNNTGINLGGINIQILRPPRLPKGESDQELQVPPQTRLSLIVISSTQQ